jgi:hypothetical protein
MSKNPHAVALGRKGGAATKGITSEAKRAASRANVAKARTALLKRTWCASPGCENKHIENSYFCVAHQG